MFVSGSKYKELQDRYTALQKEHFNLMREKNGEKPLADTQPVSSQFNEAEMKNLIFLCHPDKHDNNSTATEITKKLLDMRRR